MTCGKTVSTKNFSRHQKSHDNEKKFDCYQCSKKFNTKGHLVEHLQIHRKPVDIKCELCSKTRYKAVYNKSERYFLMLKEYENKLYSTK